MSGSLLGSVPVKVSDAESNEMLEVMGFAEKGGHIGGQRIQHGAPLIRAIFSGHEVAIVGEAFQSQQRWQP